MLQSFLGRAARIFVMCGGVLAIHGVGNASELDTVASVHAPERARAQVSGAAAELPGVLYRVSQPGRNPAYLFGTIHVGASYLYPLPPQVLQALAHCSELVVELDIRSEAAYARAIVVHGSYDASSNIKQHLTPAALVQLTDALHALGVTVASVAHLKPWLIANLLMGWELQRNGFERMHGNETFLLKHAQQHGTRVVELESADYQLALFNTLDRAEGERYLLDALAQLADGSSLRKARATIAAWRSGDPSALDRLVPDATGGGVMAAFTRQVLLGRRNPEMAAGIERVLQNGKTSFIGVGLLHLLGTDSLPRLLAQRGYRVERVY